MQHPRTDTGPSGSHWGEKEQSVSLPVPLIIGTTLFQNPGILAPKGNPTSHVRADDNGNMSAVLTDWKPWYGLGPNSHSPVPDSSGPVPEILMG